MSKLFKTVPNPLPSKKVIIINMFYKTIGEVCVEWFINNNNEKTHPSKIRKLGKRSKLKTKNQGKANEGQQSLKLLEFTIALEQT